MKRSRVSRTHTAADIAYTASLFFAVRRVVQTALAQGKKLDPSAWLHIETLKFIADHDKPKMKDIADYLSITAPSATSLVGGLLKKGLIARSTDARDRRTAQLVLTAKGKRELARAVTRGMRRIRSLFGTLSAKELLAFTRALERIQRAGRR